MLDPQILFSDAGLLAFGPRGEEIFGRKNFLELFSVFLLPPFVEPTEAKGQSRWKGEGRALRFALCQAIKRVLAADATRDCWSQRAAERLAEIRQDHAWLTPDATVLLRGRDHAEWWTFGGLAANATLAGALASQLDGEVDYNNFALTFKGLTDLERIEEAINSVRQIAPETMRPAIDPGACHGVKFSECLPPGLVIEMLSARLTDPAAARSILAQPVRIRVGA